MMTHNKTAKQKVPSLDDFGCSKNTNICWNMLSRYTRCCEKRGGLGGGWVSGVRKRCVIGCVIGGVKECVIGGVKRRPKSRYKILIHTKILLLCLLVCLFVCLPVGRTDRGISSCR